MSATIPTTVSVYVHIPFCSRRCDYCDFATWTDKSENIDEYIDALLRQWEYSYSRWGNSDTQLTSIFFGGGTPNFIDAQYISRIIAAILKRCPIVDSTEITVESNPDHVTFEKMKAYVDSGVNRISLGIQSTQDHVLKFLGREHAKEHVASSRDIIARAGITNVSGDIIYGSANESLNDWEATLNDVLALDLKHISAYALGVEPGTPLGRDVAALQKKPTNDDDLADKYELADEKLMSHGFEWYEISNWSKPGYESKHNRAYWNGNDVIALGCAAHGFTQGKRWSTPRHIDTYLDRFSSVRNASEITDDFFLDQDNTTSIDRDQELFSLRLRTRDGVVWPHSTSQNSPMLTEFIQEGFVVNDKKESRISLTVRGRLMAHRVMVDLFEEYAHLGSDVE